MPACHVQGFLVSRFAILPSQTMFDFPVTENDLTQVGAERLALLRDTAQEVDSAVRAGSFPRNVSPMTFPATPDTSFTWQWKTRSRS